MRSPKISAQDAPPRGTYSLRHATVLAVLLALVGCGAPAGVGYDAALSAWSARPVGHYLLRIEESARGSSCEQALEVLAESPRRLVSSTCSRQNGWTVSSLFLYIAWTTADAGRCVRQVAGVGCICRAEADVRVEYDAALGYPRDVRIRRTWRSSWREQAFWRYLAQAGSLPDCTPPRNVSDRRITITELRALP
jgi:hypothetical protein